MHKHYQVEKVVHLHFYIVFTVLLWIYWITCTAPNTVLYWFREAIGTFVLKSEEAAEAF